MQFRQWPSLPALTLAANPVVVLCHLRQPIIVVDVQPSFSLKKSHIVIMVFIQNWEIRSVFIFFKRGKGKTILALRSASVGRAIATMGKSPVKTRTTHTHATILQAGSSLSPNNSYAVCVHLITAIWTKRKKELRVFGGEIQLSNVNFSFCSNKTFGSLKSFAIILALLMDTARNEISQNRKIPDFLASFFPD